LVLKKILWTNKSTNYENIPNYFSIFSLPKKTINEIFLIQTVKDNHRLIADSSQKLFKIREALREKSLYFEKTLTEAENNLFFSRFKIPDNINSGLINIYFYEIINNKVIKVTQKKLTIEKIGFIQKIEQLLYAQSLAYVFALVLFAILFSFIFNYILRRK
jgi:Fe2+ transport system protein B